MTELWLAINRMAMASTRLSAVLIWQKIYNLDKKRKYGSIHSKTYSKTLEIAKLELTLAKNDLKVAKVFLDEVL